MAPMTRSAWLTSIIVVGLALAAGSQAAQEPNPPIEVHRITDALHMLGSGATTGGNTAAFITAAGVVLVDTKLEGYGADILEQVRRFTDKPVTTIINTHVHFDHSGSNTEFSDTVHFVAHENIRRHMARTDCEPIPTNCDDFQGENAKYLPTTTFSDRLTLFAGGLDQIDLYYFGRGHTDGDTFVVFKAARTMHTGDMFQGKLLRSSMPRTATGGARSSSPDPDPSDQRHSGRRHHHHRALGDAAGLERPGGLSGFLCRPGRANQRSLDAGRSADEAIAAYEKPARIRCVLGAGDRHLQRHLDRQLHLSGTLGFDPDAVEEEACIRLDDLVVGKLCLDPVELSTDGRVHRESKNRCHDQPGGFSGEDSFLLASLDISAQEDEERIALHLFGQLLVVRRILFRARRTGACGGDPGHARIRRGSLESGCGAGSSSPPVGVALQLGDKLLGPYADATFERSGIQVILGRKVLEDGRFADAGCLSERLRRRALVPVTAE